VKANSRRNTGHIAATIVRHRFGLQPQLACLHGATREHGAVHENGAAPGLGCVLGFRNLRNRLGRRLCRYHQSCNLGRLIKFDRFDRHSRWGWCELRWLVRLPAFSIRRAVEELTGFDQSREAGYGLLQALYQPLGDELLPRG
jgi:hypothetical protein